MNFSTVGDEETSSAEAWEGVKEVGNGLDCPCGCY